MQSYEPIAAELRAGEFYPLKTDGSREMIARHDRQYDAETIARYFARRIELQCPCSCGSADTVEVTSRTETLSPICAPCLKETVAHWREVEARWDEYAFYERENDHGPVDYLSEAYAETARDNAQDAATEREYVADDITDEQLDECPF